MLSAAEIDAAAAALDEAERTRVQTGLLSLKHPGMTMDDAYAVQAAWVKRKLAAGRKVTGWKIGLTSKAMQYALNIDIPDSGVLFDDMMFADGDAVPKDRFIQPRIEAEIAFVMKAPLKGPNIGIFDVLNATDYVTPALEILETRMHRIDPETKAPRKVMDTISDNAANVGIILGGRPIKPLDLDLRWVSALLYKNGVIEETGVAAGVLNHPANGISWLAKKFAPHGVALEPGQIILAGSFTRPVKVVPGDTIHVDYGPLGNISARFV